MEWSGVGIATLRAGTFSLKRGSEREDRSAPKSGGWSGTCRPVTSGAARREAGWLPSLQLPPARRTPGGRNADTPKCIFEIARMWGGGWTCLEDPE